MDASSKIIIGAVIATLCLYGVIFTCIVLPDSNSEEPTILYSESFSFHNNVTDADLKGTLIHYVKDNKETICISAHFVKTEKDKVGVSIVPISDPCSPKIIGTVNGMPIIESDNLQRPEFVEIGRQYIWLRPDHYEGDFITEIPCNHNEEPYTHEVWIVLDHLKYPGTEESVGKLDEHIIWECNNNEFYNQS